jgi:hypothetical protein
MAQRAAAQRVLLNALRPLASEVRARQERPGLGRDWREATGLWLTGRWFFF